MAKVLRRVARKSGWTRQQYQEIKRTTESLTARGREECKLLLESMLRGEVTLPEVQE